MTRAVATPRRAGIVLVLLAAACTPPRMTLMNELYREVLPEPYVVGGHYVCDVQAVRGRLDAAPGGRQMAVDVTFRDAAAQRLPPHLEAYGAVDDGADAVGATFAMTEADSRKRWPEDYAAGATRLALGLRFQDANYFVDGTAAAEVTFAGTVAPEHVAQVIEAPAIDEDRVWQDLAIPTGLEPLLRCVRRHSFGALIGLEASTPRERCDPLAWVAPDGRLLTHDDVLLLLQPWRSLELGRLPANDLELDGCGLLLRLVHGDGSMHYLRVPLALLREGDDLALVRREHDVGWSRREVWRARMQASAGTTGQWPDAGLHLAATRVAYGFDDLRLPSRAPWLVARALLTPFAFVADVLAATNPVLQAVVDYFVGDEPRPFQPGRGNR